MPSKNSYHTVAEQVITMNNNLVDIMSKINQVITSSTASVTLSITNQSGIANQFSIPSFGYIQSQIDRLNNNVNSIYNIDGAGSYIQPSSSNVYKKVVTVDLNVEPNDISQLDVISKFVSNTNLFFEGMTNPQMSVQINLDGKIDRNVKSVLSRRYIIDFEQDSAGNFTNLGQSALNSFNNLFRNNNNIDFVEFLNWHTSTPGISNPSSPTFDEKIFNLEPNKLQYDGIFSVLKTEEDTVNGILWYWLNTLNYVDTQTGQIKQLSIGDQLIVNQNNLPSSTIYTIVNISNSSSSPKVNLKRFEGMQPIPVGYNTLKIYSPVLYTNKVDITIGYNERTVLFIKPLNIDTYILSKNWSIGTGFWTNDLTLSSTDSYNGSSMEQYYINNVTDYGNAIRDLVAKKIPNALGSVPNAPQLDSTNFQVVQDNQHLTNTSNSVTLKSLYSQQKSLQSDINQINQAISDKNKQLQITRFTSDAAKNQFMNELDRLNKTKATKTASLNSTVANILSITNSTNNTVDYTYSVRGFWDIPSPIITNGTNPQQVVQFIIQYKYLSSDGTETPVNTINLSTTSGTSKVAAFPNWSIITSDLRSRTYNTQTGQYTWDVVDNSNPDVVNINQVSIPIKNGEQVQIRVKSVSEVGWPESPLMSDWSNILTISFPQSLSNNVNQTSAIITDANKADIQSSIQASLTAQGLDQHLSEQTTINNTNYYHNASSILSGFKDSNGIALSLYEYISSLNDRITQLEQQISLTKGQLQVIVFNNSEQFIVKNGSQLSFTVECEDYLDPYTSTGVPTGRVYSNNIYVIKNFLVQLSNLSTTSPLGLLSSRTYVNSTNTDIYNPSAPQSFWVDNQDNLIFSNLTGLTKTQLDNQFLWSVNYDSVNQTSVSQLSGNIGNGFVSNNSNSITNVLSSNQYNIGYSENSILSFVGSNNSLLDTSKWIDTTISVSSTNKLLTTIHPSIDSLNNIVESNSSKNHSLEGGSQNNISIPINIYFKMNALDSSQSGLNYEYINLNSATTTIKHTKEIKFFLETDVDNRPFIFSIIFNINRNKVIVSK